MKNKALIVAGAVIVVVVLVLLLSGGGGATPRARLETFKAAMTDKNFEDAWDMLSSGTQVLFEEGARQKKDEMTELSGPAKEELDAKLKLMELDSDEKVQAMDGEALFVGLCKLVSRKDKKTWLKIARSGFLRLEYDGDEKAPADGDRAKVFVRTDGKDEDKPLLLVRENGDWRVDLKDMMQP